MGPSRWPMTSTGSGSSWAPLTARAFSPRMSHEPAAGRPAPGASSFKAPRKPAVGLAKRPRPVSGAPEERAGRRRDRDAPSELAKPPFEVRGLMRNLHDPVGRPHRGAPLDGGRRRTLDELVWRAVAVIDVPAARGRRLRGPRRTRIARLARATARTP